MRPVSVTVIARDEEDRIGDAVASALWAEEVLVLDSGSSDRTVAVARAAGARVEVAPWNGYGVQKNRAAALASYDWVFSLDADERVGEVTARAIRELPGEGLGCAAFRVRRRNRFAGRAIRHWPWAWDTTVRFYDRRLAHFDQRLVHESLLCVGRVGRLPGVLEHFGYRGWEDLLERQRVYARLGAEQAAAGGRRPRPGDLTLRPLATLLRHLVGRGYLVGGALGFRLALMAARGTRRKYVLLRQLQR